MWHPPGGGIGHVILGSLINRQTPHWVKNYYLANNLLLSCQPFPFINIPRPVPDSCTSSIIGGGTAFLLREPCTLLLTPTATFKSFELSSVTIKLPHFNLALYNIHRPPQSNTKSRHSVSFSQFLEDFQTLISSVSILLYHW